MTDKIIIQGPTAKESPDPMLEFCGEDVDGVHYIPRHIKIARRWAVLQAAIGLLGFCVLVAYAVWYVWGKP